jgi:hypothetical protein
LVVKPGQTVMALSSASVLETTSTGWPALGWSIQSPTAAVPLGNPKYGESEKGPAGPSAVEAAAWVRWLSSDTMKEAATTPNRPRSWT